ncbi:phage protein [Streptococcus pyogenes]|nr:phage protein [Streptococcus pyogenes]VHC97038.1 phage protein [Streptococcus pyogenes]VHD19491.1 phage protein [Streptococcus pyogenes]
MFGDLEHTFTSRNGKEKTSIEFEGGLLPAILVLGGIAWFITK